MNNEFHFLEMQVVARSCIFAQQLSPSQMSGEHVKHVKPVLTLPNDVVGTPNFKECDFFTIYIAFNGYVICNGRCKVLARELEVIEDFNAQQQLQIPVSLKDLHSSFRSMRSFGAISAPSNKNLCQD